MNTVSNWLGVDVKEKTIDNKLTLTKSKAEIKGLKYYPKRSLLIIHPYFLFTSSHLHSV